MRKSIVFVLLVVASMVIPCLAQDKPNFSGTWVVDREKSDPMMGGGMRGGGGGGEQPQVTLVITHEGNNLNISRKMIMGGQERVQDLKYTTDGAENSNPGMGGQAVVSKSHWDGQKLVIEWSQSRSTPQGDFTINTKEVRSLSDDGKVMTIETSTSGSPRGDMTRKTIFNKQ